MCISPSLFYAIVSFWVLSYLFSVVLYIYACASVKLFYSLQRILFINYVLYRFICIEIYCLNLCPLTHFYILLIQSSWLFSFLLPAMSFWKNILLYIVLWVGSNLLFFLYFKTVFLATIPLLKVRWQWDTTSYMFEWLITN